jgi:hypothetical protein
LDGLAGLSDAGCHLIADRSATAGDERGRQRGESPNADDAGNELTDYVVDRLYMRLAAKNVLMNDSIVPARSFPLLLLPKKLPFDRI